MRQDEMIDDIINMLDSSMSEGAGHVNISVKNGNLNYNQTDIEKAVETLGCTDCAAGDLACNVPTLHEGLDDKEE